MRPMEDDESLAVGERLPMGIGLGEMAFDEAMLAFIFNDEG